MPDALQILREDHRKVKDIFRQFEDTEDQQTKKQLVDQALTELTVHAKLEEEIFYPAVRREGGTGELIDEAEEEHHVAEMLIDELRGMRPTDERYDAKFKVLSESVKMHIDEEEANTLPKAAELGPEALRRIGQQMEQRRPALMQQAQKAPAKRATTTRTTGRRTSTTRPRSTMRRSTTGRRTTASRSTRASSTRGGTGRRTTTSRSGGRSTGSRATSTRGTTARGRTATTRSRSGTTSRGQSTRSRNGESRTSSGMRGTTAARGRIGGTTRTRAIGGTSRSGSTTSRSRSRSAK